VEDNAGWHRSKKASIPKSIEIEFLPPYSPELQPAERLWQLVDEPLVNQYFETINEIEDVLVERCCVVSEMKDEVRKLTNYHWLKNTCCLHTL
jgi:transposase